MARPRYALAAAMLLSACGSVSPAQTSSPPAVPAPAGQPATMVLTGTLAAQVLGGGQVVADQHLAPDDQLVFTLSGSAGSYLYLLERSGGTLAVLHPRADWVSPADGATMQVVPQPNGATDEEEPLAGWTPLAAGPVEYLLVVAPTPRGASSNQRLEGGLDQILAPPPFIKGPSGAPATVVARLRIVRDDPSGAPHDEP